MIIHFDQQGTVQVCGDAQVYWSVSCSIAGKGLATPQGPQLTIKPVRLGAQKA
jgi:hypothetical protein